MIAIMLALAAAQAGAASQAKVERDRQSVAWESCVLAAARSLTAGTREPAATIADGALGICADDQRAFMRLTRQIVIMLPDADAFAARVTDDRRAELRGLAIARVLNVRAGRVK